MERETAKSEKEALYNPTGLNVLQQTWLKWTR